jgi:tRNA A-37 threonylcarbamoyl transferase component Bud32
MDRQREILVGKLAIGRGLLSRDAAVRCFHAAAGEPFWELAVRQGLLPRADADALVERIDSGQLVCRGRCGTRVPLRTVLADEAERCMRCGGPVYVGSAPSENAPANGDAPLSFSPFAPTLAPGVDPERTDSALPSAIAIPKPEPKSPLVIKEQKPAETPPEEKTDPGFAPFSLGAYDILAPIGRGGMGTVYRGMHRALKKMVAIKVLTAGTEDQRVRFDREIKTTATLEHPNIVKVLSGGVVTERNPLEGRPYFAMEYVAGRDAATWAREKPRSLREIVDLMVKVSEAIHFAHNRKIIHRDIKPQNVLICHEGDVPKICDFGLAKVAESDLTRTGDVMGTPQYMPPEQILGDRKKIGPPTDIYGLGAVLYQLLTGVPPFNAAKVFKLTEMVIRDKPVPPSQKNPAVPKALEALVLKALEKEPINRFITARDFAKALQGLDLPK